MKRLLIIKCSRESSWGSCQVISPNLHQAYWMLEAPEVTIQSFDIAVRFMNDDVINKTNYITDLANTIRSFKPTEIIFIDHLPKASEVLLFLSVLMPFSDLPPFVFHIYGDFTFFASNWMKLGEKLKGHPVKFVVASDAQKKLLESFSIDAACIETFLFPVNGADYYYDHRERIEEREALGIKDHEHIVLYSGRISLQKNVDVLISEYVEIFKSSIFPTKLWIVGAFDDIGAQFQGVMNYDGFMYSKISQLVDSLPREIAESIKFWGHQPKEKLRKLKNAADVFMSFSLYHDEDFGMSPAEALACGLPTLLTNWGGYSSFKSKRWFCFLLPVDITNYGHSLNTSKIHSFFEIYKLAYINHNDRTKWSKEFLEVYSIEAASKKLNIILDNKFNTFSGFNWNLEYFSNAFWSTKFGKELSRSLSPSRDNYYYQVYKNYISNKEF
jgi:hypothetical protein